METVNEDLMRMRSEGDFSPMVINLVPDNWIMEDIKIESDFFYDGVFVYFDGKDFIYTLGKPIGNIVKVGDDYFNPAAGGYLHDYFNPEAGGGNPHDCVEVSQKMNWLNIDDDDEQETQSDEIIKESVEEQEEGFPKFKLAHAGDACQ